MTTELTVFKSKKIRIEVVSGEPYLCVQDICREAELKDVESVLRRLRNTDMLNKHPGIIAMIDTDTDTGRRSMAYVNEMGLYEIVIGSRKPKAKELHRQIITALPEMRKQATAPAVNPWDAIKIMAQGMVDLESRMSKIEATQQKTAAILAPVKELTARAQINQVVRDYGYRRQTPYEDVWRTLYREFYYRYHVDLPVRAANSGKTGVQIAEEMGCAGELLGLAIFLFGK